MINVFVCPGHVAGVHSWLGRHTGSLWHQNCPCKSHVAGCRAGRRVYVHCTAGLGRAPAACIAYLYWCSDDAALRDGDVWSLDKVGARPPLAGATYMCCCSVQAQRHARGAEQRVRDRDSGWPVVAWCSRTHCWTCALGKRVSDRTRELQGESTACKASTSASDRSLSLTSYLFTRPTSAPDCSRDPAAAGVRGGDAHPAVRPQARRRARRDVRPAGRPAGRRVRGPARRRLGLPQ
jgi:hypothetical protein